MTCNTSLIAASTIVLACLLASACEAPDRDSVTVATRDSAGVQIVLNAGDADSALAAGQPQLVIGTVMGDAAYEFHEIGPIAVSQAGEILVANGGSLSIRTFDQQGRLVREFGRRGQGPGEFRSISSLILTGDSVIVIDQAARRASVFHLDGTFVANWDLRLEANRRVEPLAVTPSGVLATVRGPSLHFTGEMLALVQDTMELALFDPLSRTVKPPLRRWTGERRIAGTEVYPIGPLFEPRILLAVASDGLQYQVPSGSYSIDVFDQDGRHVRQIRRDVAPAAVTTKHVEDLIESLGQQRGSEQRAAVERAAQYPTPSHFSVLGAIIVATDGSFMVQRLDDHDPIQLERSSGFGAMQRSDAASMTTGARWDRYDPAGHYIGAARLPPRYVPRHYDGSAVLGVLEDENRVQSVARFSVGSVRAN